MLRMIVITSLLALGACNTIAGAGEDVAGGARQVQSWF